MSRLVLQNNSKDTLNSKTPTLEDSKTSNIKQRTIKD
jgi:hypothetical protein